MRLPALVLSLFLLGVPVAKAQKKGKDVLYLNNGSVLRGKLIPLSVDSLLMLETRDGSRFVFRRTEVDSVSLDQGPVRVTSDLTTEYRRRGFSHYTELGSLVASNSGVVSRSAFSIQTVNGYKFGQFFFAGFGIGADQHTTHTLLPLFGSVRGDIINRGNIIPYYFVDAGYAANLSGRDDNLFPRTTYRGGALFAAGLGVKFLFSHHTGFLLSLGYRSQRTVIEQDFGGSSFVRNEMSLNRVAVRAGFTF